MIKFRMTKKAQKKLGYTKSSEGNEVERFHSWHVNSFNVSRRIGLIFMNDLTRFSVVLFGLRKSYKKNIHEIFRKQLRKNLIRIGVDELRTKRYLSEIEDYVIDDTNDRSVIGSIADCLTILPSYVDGENLEDSELVSFINEQVNSMPMSPLKRDGFKPFPDLAIKAVLYNTGKEKNVT